jgi:hypothetical protein
MGMTIKDRFKINIVKESAAMGTLYSLMDGEECICKDVPIDKAVLYLKGYIHHDHTGFELSEYVRRQSKLKKPPKDHKIIIKDRYGDEFARITVGLNNDNDISVIQSNLQYKYDDEEDDEDHTVLFDGNYCPNPP